MSKYKFSRATDDTLNVRMDSETANKIRAIAKKERTSVQEVCRVFLQVSVKDYESPNLLEATKQ